jgi:hypothetical protein
MSRALLRPRAQASCVLLIPVSLLLIGCGGDNSSAEEDDASAAATEETVAENPHLDAADLCALVPQAAVAEAAGGIEPISSEANPGPPASCRYLFNVPEGTGSRQMSATLQMLSGFSMERMGAGANAVDVAGVGDEAWSRSFTDTYLLYARRAGLVFSVNVAGGNSANWPDQARAIAEVVLDNL